MKKLLTLAAVLAAFAFAQAPVIAQAADAPAAEKPADAPKAAMKKISNRLTKEEAAECKKEASAAKDGKAPSKKEERAAYTACSKAKKDAKKSEAAPVKDAAPKTEENK